MLGWVGDVAKQALENDSARSVVFTGARMQMTVARLLPGEKGGMEGHSHLDHFVRVEQGQARVELGSTKGQTDEVHDVGAGFGIFVPGGVWHSIVNTGESELKLWSLYSPPEYADR